MTPTGRELDVELARLMGMRLEEAFNETHNEPMYRPVWADGSPIGGEGRWWVSQTLAFKHDIPLYSSSLDAIFRKGGPVEYARQKGWGIELTIEADAESDNWNAWVTHATFDAAHAYNTDPAAALASALYEALKEMNDAVPHSTHPKGGE